MVGNEQAEKITSVAIKSCIERDATKTKEDHVHIVVRIPLEVLTDDVL